MVTVLHNRWAALPAATLSPLQITTASLPGATAGTAYSASLSAVGGRPPYTWSSLSIVPDTGSWLSLSSSGVCTGTPGTQETEVILVQVVDALGTKASQFLTLSVTGATDLYATRGPQAGDVWVDGTAGTDSSGSELNPWNHLTVARGQAMSPGQTLWVAGTVQWPDIPIGTGPSGTSGNHIMCKVWPGRSGTFNFPQIRTPGVNTAGLPGSAASSGGGYYWDWVGLGITCLDSGIFLGDITGGRTNASHFWRFIDCNGVRSGSTYTDNQGVIAAPEAVGIEIIRGSYLGPSGEGSTNQSNVWLDYPQFLNILGVLFSQGANPLYLKHTDVNSSSTPGGTIKNCIFLTAGKGFRASLNWVNYINCAFQNCYMGLDEQGGGLGNSQNCILSHNTFVNSNWLCAEDSGGAGVANNTITNNASVGTSVLKNAPFSATDPNNAIDYTANDGTGVNHYLRNHIQYTLAGYQSASAGQETHGVAGTIVLVGGSTPGSIPGNWAMSSGVGKNAASDGTDCGVDSTKLLTVN